MTNSDSAQNAEVQKYRPEMLIPFSCSREDAVKACREYYQGRTLLPGILLKESHYEEIQGGFVPYLLYSGSADLDIVYEAQDSTDIAGDPAVKKQLKEYSVHRKGRVDFKRIQVNASKDVPDSFMQHIEPFRYRDLVPIEGTREAEELGDLDEFRIDEDAAVTKKRITEVCLDAAKETVKHHYVKEQTQEVSISAEKVECVLFPMWILVTKVGRRYSHFAMNGQTGKIYGDLPLARWKAMLAFFVPAFLSGGAAYGIMRLMWYLFGTPVPTETANLIMILIAIVAGMTVANRLTSSLFEQMRRPSQKNAAADKRYESRKIELSFRNEKLTKKQMVDGKNKVVREEIYK